MRIRDWSSDVCSSDLKAIDELVSISKATGAPAIIYHLKESGQENWDKLPAVIDKVEKARAAGLDISATMYTYTAGATGLDAAMPLWVQDRKRVESGKGVS